MSRWNRGTSVEPRCLRIGMSFMRILKVALLQMIACGNTIAANQVKGERLCRRAKAMGADIALFPEMWSVGMTFFAPHLAGDHERWQAQAISHDHPFIAHFSRLARELNMAIALTYLERWPGAPRNSVSLIDRQGQLLLTYA